MAALSVNVFIVGINQISDVEIDRVNKPFLPIAAGELSRERAWWIVVAAALLPLVLALTQGALELAAVAPRSRSASPTRCRPSRLKRFPIVASLCVSGVRSAIVNLGVAAHFPRRRRVDPGPVWALSLFVLPFSLAIAILKDVPDAEGDRRYSDPHVHRATRRPRGDARRPGRAHARLPRDGVARPAAARRRRQPVVLVGGHLAALGAALVLSRQADPTDRAEFTRFYMRVWQLFFLEYASFRFPAWPDA